MPSHSLSNTMSNDCLSSESLVSSNTVGFLGESSSVYDEDEELNENILCSWCQKMGPKMFTLRCTNGLKLFCSELCLTQCRRASFKKNKVCDWCKHVRHTVNYVDFQDGQQQLQFCSDKCLNQYKMNIFCRETQVHLNSFSTVYRSTSPSTSCPSHLHGLNRILDNSMTIKETEGPLVNPELRMKNQIPDKLSFSTSLITSTTSSPSAGSISNAKCLSDSMVNFRCSLIEKSIDNSTNKSATIEDDKDKVGKEEPCTDYKPSVPKKSLTKPKVRSRQTDPKNKCTIQVKVEESCESSKLRSCKNHRNTIGDENQNHEPINIEIGKDLQPKSAASSKSISNQTHESIIDPSTSLANVSMPLLSRFTPNLLQNHANGYRTDIPPFPDYLSQRLSNFPNRDGSLNSMGSFLNPLQLELLRHRTFNSPIRHSMFPLSSPVVVNQPDSGQRSSISSLYTQLPEPHNFNSQSIPFNEQNNSTNARIQYSVPHPFLFPLPLPIPLPIPIPFDLASFIMKPTISTQDKEVQVNVYERSSGFITLDSKMTPDNAEQNAGFIKNKRFKRDITISI